MPLLQGEMGFSSFYGSAEFAKKAVTNDNAFYDYSFT